LTQLKICIQFFRTKAPAAVDNANVFSFVTFQWLSDTITKARKGLDVEDIPPLSKYDSSDFASQR